MARTFTSGTLTDGGGSVPTNMANVQSAIRDGILLNAAWSLVEEFNGSGGATHTVVLKCAAASSGLATDIFFVIARGIVAGGLSFYAGEAYNAGTHVLTAAPGPTAGTKGVDIDGKPTTPSTVDFSVGQVQSQTPLTMSVTAAATMYYAVITDVDHTVVVAGTVAVYFGGFTSLVQGYSDPNPVVFALMLDGNVAGVSAQSTTTRHPVNAVATLAASAFVIDGPATRGFVPTSELAITASDKMQNSLPHAYDIPIQHATANAAASGRLRGKFKKLCELLTPPVGSAIGDTFTMGGTTWLIVAVTGGRAIISDEGA